MGQYGRPNLALAGLLVFFKAHCGQLLVALKVILSGVRSKSYSKFLALMELKMT